MDMNRSMPEGKGPMPQEARPMPGGPMPGSDGPMPGKPGKRPRRRPGPPPDIAMRLAQGEGPSEEMKIIMPDFIRLRNKFFHLDIFFVIINFIFELLFFANYYYGHTLKVNATRYFITNLVLSTAINVLIIVIMCILRHRLPKDNSEMRQNFLPIIGCYFICLVIAITHCEISETLCIFCVPIFMSTIFTSKFLCHITTRFCLLGALISALKHFFACVGIVARCQAFLESLIVFLVLIIAMQVSLALLSMTTDQRDKMFDFFKNIKEAQVRAEAANRAKSTFLANMSHEIRTPINAILGMDEMILRESRDHQISEYAENIYSASTSLLSLVNDVLDISKIESGKLEIVDINYDTASLVHDCCNMINERAAKKNLEFKVFCNPNLPSQLYGDEVHLRQVTINLLSNAAKYTQKGSITLSVDSENTDGKFFFVVAVKDTGIGIKPENLEKLFSQFTRFDMDKNRTIEGTGLGLSITKQLVELMEGTITAESTYGEGSKFTVRIPQKVADSTPMGNFHEHYDEITKKNTAYRQNFEAPDARILVVDDVEVNLKVAVNLLKQTKIFVDTAKSGRICLEKVVQNHYDIIFMDHMMPELSGIDTFRKMQDMEDSLNKNTPVIMLTANAISGIKDEYLKIGFSDYLSKPILGDKLEKMILKYLPEDKIKTVRKEETAAPADTPAETDSPAKTGLALLQDFYQSYPKANVARGLNHYGQSTDILISALHAFCNKIKTEPIVACFERQDIAGYGDLAHDIKRYAKENGFDHLSSLASDMEEAALKEDMNYIRKNHINFIIECQNIINAVKSTLNRRKS